VYVEQGLRFENPEFSNHIFMLHKALYGLKESLRAWYEAMSKFLLENDSRQVNIDKIFFIKRKGKTS